MGPILIVLGCYTLFIKIMTGYNKENSSDLIFPLHTVHLSHFAYDNTQMSCRM